MFANNDSAWRAARDLVRAGVAVRTMIDVRDTVDPAVLAPLKDAGARILLGSRVVGTSGKRLRGIEVLTGGHRSSMGHMTSTAYSPSLGHSIGLGLLSCGPSRIGERVRAVDPVRGADIEVEICNPVFIDPQGDKLRV